MDECIDYLGKAKIFSTLDASSEYWQVDINVSSQKKIALKSYH